MSQAMGGETGESSGGDRAIVTGVLEDFGLTHNEAKVLAVLLEAGSATSGKLAEAAGVVRPNVYRELESLAARGLIEEVPGGRRRWVCPDRDAVIDRLCREQEERRRQLLGRADEARRAIARMGTAPSVAMPYVRVLRPVQVNDLYFDLFAKAHTEVLLCTRGPFGPAAVNPAQMDAIARGLQSRALYRKLDWLDPRWHQFFGIVDIYAEAGVEVRLAEELPLPFVVFDATAALVVLEDPIEPVPASPTPLHIDHPGFAVALVDLFERYWETAEPYQPVGR